MLRMTRRVVVPMVFRGDRDLLARAHRLGCAVLAVFAGERLVGWRLVSA